MNQEFERDATQEVVLAEISDASGSIKITKLPKPLNKDQLNTKVHIKLSYK